MHDEKSANLFYVLTFVTSSTLHIDDSVRKICRIHPEVPDQNNVLNKFVNIPTMIISPFGNILWFLRRQAVLWDMNGASVFCYLMEQITSKPDNLHGGSTSATRRAKSYGQAPFHTVCLLYGVHTSRVATDGFFDYLVYVVSILPILDSANYIWIWIWRYLILTDNLCKFSYTWLSISHEIFARICFAVPSWLYC